MNTLIIITLVVSFILFTYGIIVGCILIHESIKMLEDIDYISSDKKESFIKISDKILLIGIVIELVLSVLLFIFGINGIL